MSETVIQPRPVGTISWPADRKKSGAPQDHAGDRRTRASRRYSVAAAGHTMATRRRVSLQTAVRYAWGSRDSSSSSRRIEEGGGFMGRGRDTPGVRAGGAVHGNIRPRCNETLLHQCAIVGADAIKIARDLRASSLTMPHRTERPGGRRYLHDGSGRRSRYSCNGPSQVRGTGAQRSSQSPARAPRSRA